jgi:opacity protein-like surface antigen
MLLATSANSMELRPAIGISGNYGAFAATGIENNFNEAGTAIDETTKEYGAFDAEFGSIFVEVGLNDIISVGLDYVAQDIETPQNISNEGMPNQSTVEARFDDLTTVYAKINVPLGGTYVKVGYSQVDVISKERMGNTDGAASEFGNDSSSGMTLGLGYDQEIAGGVSLRAEITASDFSDVSANSDQNLSPMSFHLKNHFQIHWQLHLYFPFFL